jgi:predicted  nucleic acid-binding Zn-ribbon protein
MLVVSVPIMVVLAVLLTTGASSSLTSATEQKGQSLARAVTLHVEDWMSERQENMTVIAGQATDRLGDPAIGQLLAGIDKTYGDFTVIEITDLTGKVVASSRPASAFDPAGQGWFRTVASGQPTTTSPVEQDGHIHWVVAQPILSTSGQPEGAVIGSLNPTVLYDLLNAEGDQHSEMVAVDDQHRLVYDTAMGKLADDTALLNAGGLRTTVENSAVRLARLGETGTARFTDLHGRQVVGGYDHADGLNWVILAQHPASSVLAPVTTQRRQALVIVAAGTLAAVLGALAFGTKEARKLRALAEETGTAGVEVNSSAAELSASSDELAATTTQQSAAVTQATATTEELARASAAIADTVDGVARQTSETKDNLTQAEADIGLSSERTLALAGRVNEIDALLTLINDLADQTNLLALNAGIEAARAGEHGLGFAVVAEEVRRLAERSKVSARDIAAIVEAVQGETNATVMAMEKGAKQMRHGVTLLEQVSDATAQVRLTTQQQRSATAQVVETMEQLTDASRQVSSTAQQIAAAAGNLADLAGNLETSAAAASDRY